MGFSMSDILKYVTTSEYNVGQGEENPINQYFGQTQQPQQQTVSVSNPSGAIAGPVDFISQSIAKIVHEKTLKAVGDKAYEGVSSGVVNPYEALQQAGAISGNLTGQEVAQARPLTDTTSQNSIPSSSTQQSVDELQGIAKQNVKSNLGFGDYAKQVAANFFGMNNPDYVKTMAFSEAQGRGFGELAPAVATGVASAQMTPPTQMQQKELAQTAFTAAMNKFDQIDEQLAKKQELLGKQRSIIPGVAEATFLGGLTNAQKDIQLQREGLLAQRLEMQKKFAMTYGISPGEGQVQGTAQKNVAMVKSKVTKKDIISGAAYHSPTLGWLDAKGKPIQPKGK
jgi:hypothetical protein